MPGGRHFLRALLRTQPMGGGESQLKRCLSTLDLTLLGIGSTLGLGIYVIAGQVASSKAGPAVTISFAIAAIASVFAGLCYAEFGARVPRAGSAYIYSYVTVGELMAFIIGWNLILEYVIGAASVARGYSGYIDSLTKDRDIEVRLKEIFPINIPNMSNYPDFLAFGIIIFLTITLCFGVQASSKFNNVFTGINLMVVLFAVIGGSIKANTVNWNLSMRNSTDYECTGEAFGQGGFMPHGIPGIMSGAATCFYAFIGFDVIATTGEETKNPQRSIPISIVVSLLVVFLAYFSISTVQTLMVPYCEQNVPAPLPFVFGKVGWETPKLIVSVGALAGLSTSLLCSMFPLPRILYAMATDGLIFRPLATVNQRFQTPLLATLISGLFASVMAMMFDVASLADMMSIGTFLAYSLVAVCVLVLRYKNEPTLSPSPSAMTENGLVEKNSQISLIGQPPPSNGVTGSYLYGTSDVQDQRASFMQLLLQVFNRQKLTRPNDLSYKISMILIVLICLVIIAFNSLLAFVDLEPTMLGCIGTLGTLWLLLMVALWNQPSSNGQLTFKVPFVPFVPFFSIAVNIYLMLQLSELTWTRFGVWMALGFAIYFLYGIWNSNLRNPLLKPQSALTPTISKQVQLAENTICSRKEDSDNSVSSL